MPGLVGLVGGGVEIHVLGGAVIRGELVSVTGDWLTVEKAVGGRLAFVRVAAVASVQDECAPGLRTASRKSAEDVLGGGDEL